MLLFDFRVDMKEHAVFGVHSPTVGRRTQLMLQSTHVHVYMVNARTVLYTHIYSAMLQCTCTMYMFVYIVCSHPHRRRQQRTCDRVAAAAAARSQISRLHKNIHARQEGSIKTNRKWYGTFARVEVLTSQNLMVTESVHTFSL